MGTQKRWLELSLFQLSICATKKSQNRLKLMANNYALLNSLMGPLVLFCGCVPVTKPETNIADIPSYAFKRVDNYEIMCDQNPVTITYGSEYVFKKEDGNFKTRREFCKEYNTGSLIK